MEVVIFFLPLIQAYVLMMSGNTFYHDGQ